MEKDEFDQITDKHIPQRPVSAVEGASYTVVIIGGERTPLDMHEHVNAAHLHCSRRLFWVAACS